MKNAILVLSILTSYNAFAKAPASSIAYQQGVSAEKVASELGITAEFYHDLIDKKVSELKAKGQCGLSKKTKLISYQKSSVEDTAQEEVQYHTVELTFDKLKMQIGLIEISGQQNYNPTEYLEVNCL